ncbi:MAG: hypothetical protein P8130_14485 [Deltaproteobacteria bacterium]
MFSMIFLADTKGKISSEISELEMAFPSYIIFNDMKKKLLNIDLAPAVRPLYSYLACCQHSLAANTVQINTLDDTNAARKSYTLLPSALFPRAATVARLAWVKGRTGFSRTSMLSVCQMQLSVTPKLPLPC